MEVECFRSHAGVVAVGCRGEDKQHRAVVAVDHGAVISAA